MQTIRVETTSAKYDEVTGSGLLKTPAPRIEGAEGRFMGSGSSMRLRGMLAGWSIGIRCGDLSAASPRTLFSNLNGPGSQDCARAVLPRACPGLFPCAPYGSFLRVTRGRNRRVSGQILLRAHEAAM